METKYIFFSGKGGVGKTSMACTTGVYYADQGKNTLIVTTDPAANLSDVFEQEIGYKVTKINGLDNLFAMEIDPNKATEEYKERSLAPMRDLFDEEMLKVADEQLSGPCTSEMASFDKFIDFMEEIDYDIIIFDTAPTGHTIRLLELPVDWSRHIEESAKGSGQTCLGPVALIQESKDKYDRAVARLRDSHQTDFIFVMQPEQTSLEETIRSSNELNLIDIKTTHLIVNGFIPEDETDNPFFKDKYNAQMKQFNKIQKTFPQIPIQTMELFDDELKGIERFRISAKILFENQKVKKETLFEEQPKIYEDQHPRPDIDKLIYPSRGLHKNIFVSGKGGVGKTSVACIIAVASALKGYKTLLMTTDPAAHIGSVLDKPVGDEITHIEGIENLYAVKIDQKKATEEYKKKVLADADCKFDETTIKAMEEELNSPCTEEMAAFLKFIDYASKKDYQVIVFDTAPTGHTLRLLELPMDWSKQIQLKTGLSSSITEEDRKEKEKFDQVMEMMRDKNLTTFSFVMYPENTPIMEAYRASKELESTSIHTQLIIANLIIPPEQAKSPFFQKRRNMQLRYIENIKEKFEKAAIIEMPLFEKEIKGLEMLEKISMDLFACK